MALSHFDMKSARVKLNIASTSPSRVKHLAMPINLDLSHFCKDEVSTILPLSDASHYTGYSCYSDRIHKKVRINL
jgi:hypothetical protein